ncbi:MAG TPA: type II secretion system protein [Pyrinomonadaceae bacterium]|nr:type II secretion system protein [Pyrinomonadaceae bacterium]
MWKRLRGGARRVRRVAAQQTASSPAAAHALRRSSGGWTLIELVVVITILSILSVGVIPLVKTSVRRQRELRLRETLREMREAIKEFHRDTVGMQCTGIGGAGGGAAVPGANPQQQQQQIPTIDPRSRVVISDCTIFGVDNPDRYPPSLETLVEGVNVVSRTTPQVAAGAQATDNKLLSTKKKVYLRQIPVDPVTGKAEWDLRSCYDPADASSWGGENVFDVRSKAEGEALNGEKYSDW